MSSLSDLIKYCHIKQRFIYMPPTKPKSVFDWNTGEPTVFATDDYFKAKAVGKRTASEIMTEVVKRKREENETHGTIYGLSKDRDAALLATKRFHVYSKARAAKKKEQ
jgi:predicted CopG family antitoxin